MSGGSAAPGAGGIAARLLAGAAAAHGACAAHACGGASWESPDEPAPDPLDSSASAKASVSVGTKALGQLDAKSGAAVEAHLLGKSGHLGSEAKETKSYVYDSLTSGSGEWTKETFGEYEVQAMGAGLGEKGLTLSLADAEIKGYQREEGTIKGTWVAGFTTVTTTTVGELKGELGVEESSLSASVSAAVASERISVGVNFLGLNASVFGEFTAGAKLGAKLGAENSLRAGILGAGVTIGAAKTSESRAGWLNLFEDLATAAASANSPLDFGPASFQPLTRAWPQSRRRRLGRPAGRRHQSVTDRCRERRSRRACLERARPGRRGGAPRPRRR